METPLNNATIRCHNCEQVVADFADWFIGECPGDAATGHSLTWPEILLLKFQTETKKEKEKEAI